MTVCVAHPSDQAAQADFFTSSVPSPPWGDVLFAWNVVGTSGWSAIDEERFDSLLLFGPGTTSGWLREADPPPSQNVLAELRSRTQLTWAQLARALGVQRRSLHFWARGEKPSAANFERLMGILGIVRAIDRGDPSETTALLLESQGGRPSAFSLLCEGRDDEVLELLVDRDRSTKPEVGRRRPPRLTREERERRSGGLAPLDRLDALHDVGATPVGRLIAAVPIPPREG